MKNDIIKKLFITLSFILGVALASTAQTVNGQGVDVKGLPMPDVVASVNAPRAKAVFIGNSITEIWGWDHPEFFARNHYVNKGIGGQVTGQFVARFNQDVISLNPYCVVMMGGVNDIAHNVGYAPTLEGIRDNFKQMVDMARQHKIVPIIVSTPPAQNVTWNGPVENATQQIVELNKLLRSYAEENGITYLDVHSMLRDDNNKLRKEYCRGNTDSVHLNSIGYSVIETYIKHAIDSVLADMDIVDYTPTNGHGNTAFLSTFDSFVNLRESGDDDEIAAAEWFLSSFGGDFLPVKDITTTDLKKYKVIWLDVSRLYGFSQFPAELCTSSVIEAIQDYYLGGGNLLLTSYGVKYLNIIGRANNMFGELWEEGSNGGTIGPDINDASYGPIPVYGRFFSTGDNEFSSGPITHQDDPIFDGMTYEDRVTDVGMAPGGVTYTYRFYPLIGPGPKEVHRIVWTADCESNAGGVYPGGIDNPMFLKSFEEEQNMEALATVEYTLAYFRVCIGRWNPTSLYKGKAITISDTGYEWYQNSRMNPYQENVIRLTENALMELGGIPNDATGIKNTYRFVEEASANTIYDLQGRLVPDIQSKGFYIKNNKKFFIK